MKATGIERRRVGAEDATDILRRGLSASRPMKRCCTPWMRAGGSPALLPLLILVLCLCSCSPQVIYRDTLVRDTVLKVQPPEIREVLVGAPAGDSSIAAVKTRGNDTVVHVRYVPQTRTFYLRAKPDTVSLTLRDTVTVTRPQLVQAAPEEESFFAKLWSVIKFFLGLVIAGLVGVGFAKWDIARSRK